MRRPLLFVVLVMLAAGCGSSKSAPPTSTIYQGAEWAVVVKGGRATALHRVGGGWRPDRSGRVTVRFLGPRGTVTPVFQVAAELSAKAPLVESALWVDGVELLEKGGGLSARRGTIYGAPVAPLRRGRHVAVAYARTATSGTAVARVFRVR